MDRFGPATRAWFTSAFEAATPVQEQGWARIAAGEHALLIAPTGSGKTLAAFLWCVDRLSHGRSSQRPGRASQRAGRAGHEDAPGVSVVYVSPLKALVYDVERNLRAPLVGIARAAERLGIDVALPSVAVRTGDTPARERQAQARHPADILITTPESLYLLLTSQARDTLRTVDTIVVDEVHALAPTKRGAHLALSLERLSHLAASAGRDPQRIGLSATARPTGEVARFLGGDRPVTIVDAGAAPRLDVEIVVPVADMTRPEDSLPAPSVDADGGVSLLGPQDSGERGMWPAIYPRLLELIRGHRTTIVFVNSRGLCERLTRRLNELASAESSEAAPEHVIARSHHGSLAHAERKQIEEALKAGQIQAIVATSSLELGIDMGAVDLVILVESPGSAASGLQRVGRAGHAVGEVSRGRLFPKHRGDLLEAAVVVERMGRGAIESLRVPRNPLDVLAQHIVAMVASEPWHVDALRAVVHRSASFRDLPDDAFTGVLDMLAGRYPSHAFADLAPRIVWDRETDVLTPRRGAKTIALISGGTIPDRGTYGVYLGEDGPRVGELDEEMVHETTPGQTFTLGATTWRVERITRDRVLVSPAPGEAGKLPFWRGDGPGRPIELGRAIGAFVRELAAMDPGRALAHLAERHRLDPLAAKNLIAYIDEQRAATGTLPTDRSITIERFRDELGDWRVCILSPFGARVHAPWALALQARLEKGVGFAVQTMWSDDGIVLRLAAGDEMSETSQMSGMSGMSGSLGGDALVPDPEEVEDLVVAQLGQSALFAGQFRENAARALLMPRGRAGQRTPLWVQRLKSQELLAVAREYPAFPIVMETYRSCLQDVFDLPALVELLGAVRRREVRVDLVETEAPSPFARSLVFAYVAAYLYEGDSPLAERKAQALSLDRQLLRELLGQEELRELLDAGVIDALEAELQCLDPERQARHADGLHDVLRRVGDLSETEIRARFDEVETSAGDAIDALLRTRRAVRMRIGGEPRWVAMEDVALYRDSLGAPPPPGVPDAFLGPAAAPVEGLLGRFGRTHGPFATAAVATRYALPVAQVDTLLGAMAAQGKLLRGAFRPGGVDHEWCDPEILRRIKRRTLAKLRNEVAPVEGSVLGRFLPAWHGVGQGGRGRARLEEVLSQLEGVPLSFQELESAILPGRVSDFAPRMLDELGAMGWLVWVGHGALGSRDGRIALYRRDRVAALLAPTEVPEALSSAPEALPGGPPSAPPEASGELGPLHRAILDHLAGRGASFFVALLAACAPASSDDVLAALGDLAWAGLITNDTFQPLRLIGKLRAGAGRRRARENALAASGRWSLVRELLAGAPSPTERAHRRAQKLLERHGIVSREVAAIETLPGGFSTVYPVLRAMEEAGKVRRGYFVEGLGGAQFASPGAVDRLRSMRQHPGDERAVVLAAVDPANPYGWLLPWPAHVEDGAAGLRRVAGARVVLVGGEIVLYLDRGARRMVTFPVAAERIDLLSLAVRALATVASARRGKMLRIETIDGESARRSPHAATLHAAGFFADPRGLVLEVS
jgi:ATP-dependent helicase Lhr and Lhr-like helicase